MTSPEKREDELEAAFQIVGKLVRQSQESQIKWAEGGADLFWTAIAGSLIGVSSVDGDGRQPFRIVFQDQNGNVVQEFNSTDEFEDAGRRDAWPSLLADLYAEARRRGRKFNKMIDEINDELDRRSGDIPF
jgi:hypothetical protein